MTVAIINNYQPHIGIGKYCFNLFERFRTQNKDVDMVYLESRDNPYQAGSGIVKVKQFFNLPLLNKTLSWYYYFPPKIPRGYDLYHVTSQFLARIAKFRRPCVITHMDAAPLLFKYPQHLKFFVRMAMKHYRNAERIIAISEKSKSELVGFNIVPEEKITAINLGYDERVYMPMNKEECRQKLKLPKEKKIILYIGSEEERKNVPTLLKALHVLKDDLEDFVLVRVGSIDPANDYLKKGLVVRHFKGIPEHDMPIFYNAADAFVFPATYEGGIAYPPLEAMACGIPTVVTDELDVFKEGTVNMKPYDANGLADIIMKILSNKQHHRKLSKAALETASRFTLKKEVNDTYSIYEDVLGMA
jgi:glycosyltransferase involved in cell wall biosynthesis